MEICREKKKTLVWKDLIAISTLKRSQQRYFVAFNVNFKRKGEVMLTSMAVLGFETWLQKKKLPAAGIWNELRARGRNKNDKC